MLTMKYFDTDHLKKNLKRRGARGSTAMFASRGLIFLFEIAGTVVLARLLKPGDFGLVAMAMVLFRFALMFRDIGLSEATVWAEKTNQELVSSLFWISVAAGAGLTFLLGIASPLIARFYGEPRLVPITLCILPTLLFSSMCMQHQALLKRQMRFGRLASAQVAANGTAVIVAILCALGGMGFWALVVRQLWSSLFLLVSLWVFCPWRPGRPSRALGLMKMVGFGGYLSLERILQFFMRNGDNILIGKYVGGSGLGFYDKAYSLLLFPMRQINVPLSSVVVPILSRLQTEEQRFRAYYRKALGLTAMVTVPFAIFAAVAAYDIIYSVLGPKWDPSARVFLFLAPAALCSTVNVASGWVYIALGHVDRQLKFKFFASFATLIAMFIGVRSNGIEGMAVAVSAASVLCKWPQMAYCYHGTFVKMEDFVAAVGCPLAFSLIAGLLVVLIDKSFDTVGPGIINLSWKAALFMLVYALPYFVTRCGRAKIDVVLDVLKELKAR
jgi:O-antigen/teichoic acid export membrane protein